MMTAGVMSPATPAGAGSNLGTPSSMFVSPSTRRQIGITSPAPLLSTTNEDEKERRERRRSKVLELQRKNLGSPGTPTDRLRSTPLSGLTSNQLSDHYSNCIKLSTENKINSKNAFGLHLIDYMTELLKRKELENFQVASSTLDASAKIYAGRVDAVHAETYKVLSGLGRGADKQDTGNDDMETEIGDGGEENEKKKKRVRNSKTIETNLKNINLNKLDLEFEVDPLFQVMSAAFDEGGTGGLLMNQLRCLDDCSALVFDSSTIMIGADSPSADEGKNTVDLTEIKEIFRGVDLNSFQVCQAFSNFKFTNWNQNSEDFLGNKLGASDHAFDVNAEPEPLPEDNDDDQHGGGFMGSDDFPDVCDMDMSDSEEVHTDGNFNAGETREHIFVKDGSEATLVENTLNSIRSGTVGSLIQVLATEPSDYSYFNTNLLRTWAGPSHWKLRPLSKDPSNVANVEKTQRKKKPPFKINYEDEEVDFEKQFKESKAKTLTKATLKKYESSQTTLPKDLHYNVDKLFRLFNKPKIMVKRQATSPESLDDGIENYDYENANDRENYCPADDMCDDDDDECGGSSGFDYTAGTGELSQMSSQDLFSSRHNSTLNSISDLNGTLNGTLLTGDNLVAQPNKVAKIEIGYAKTAKKMDVKKLKTAIWNILTSEKEENKENKDNVNESEKPADLIKLDGVNGRHTFQELLETLPDKISRSAAKNLSVPIAFVCLLHLANEKTLRILDNSMADLTIEQDSN